MVLIKHEIKQARKALIIWTIAISFLLVICILIFPEMGGELTGMEDLFSSMGAFTEAFGMNQVNFGTLPGFYAVECGNILGLGGAFFAAMCGVCVLAKEEGSRTAEFLLSHPVSRKKIVTEKLIAVVFEITIMNLFVFFAAVCAVAAVGESVPWKEFCLLHFAYFLMQLEILGICFWISAFLGRGGIGIGLGVAACLYFANLIANLSEHAEFLKYITPFGYADGADIVAKGSIDTGLAILGMLYGAAGIAAAYIKYYTKDIQ